MSSLWNFVKKIIIIFPFLTFLLLIRYESLRNRYQPNFRSIKAIINEPRPRGIQKNNNSSISHFDIESETENLFDVESYLIDTNGCKIPRTDIINSKLEPLMQHFHKNIHEPYCKVYKNGNKYQPPLVDSDENSIFLLKDAVKFYKKRDQDVLKCFYKPFWKNGSDESKVTYGDKIDFIERVIIPPTVEFTLVHCLVNDELVYKDAHSFVPKKITARKKNSTKPQINVLIFGMDALSRVNFHRQMHLTDTLIEEDFIEYYGYNKLADNTFPNMIPFLTGHTVTELKNLCWPYQNSHFDDCPIIWRKYKDSGYITAYVEEQSFLSIFNFERTGFLKPPTDYYYRPFDEQAAKITGHTYLESTNLCLGPRFSSEVLLNYATKFISSMRNETTFSFFWEVGLSHDDLNLPRISDPLHAQFFSKLKHLGWYDTSAIFFISDHGIRFGKILETDEGYMEERLPLFKVSLPKWFALRYPLAYGNFVNNSKRLTTHFDAHEMLNDLNNLDDIEDDNIRRRTSEMNSLNELPRGISLFLPISHTRTCLQAGIPDNYCTCLKISDAKPMEIKNTTDAGIFLLSQINKMISKFPQCMQLKLDMIKNTKLVNITKQGKKYILLTIRTKPGLGLFEAMISHEAREKTPFSLIGTISRLNPYGNQSSCIHQPEMKLYCYCQS